MGDDDVICLSSDDEVATELPKKRPKLNNDPLLCPKTESDSGKDTESRGCKRKLQETQKLCSSISTKKPKLVTNGDIEEIIIESPRKADREPEQKKEAAKTLENRDTICVAKVKPLKTLENEAKSSSSILANPLNIANRTSSSKTLENEAKAGSSMLANPLNIANRTSSSKESNNKTITLKSDDWKLSKEKLSAESGKSLKNPDGSEPSLADVVHNFFSDPMNVKKDSSSVAESTANEQAKTSSKSGTPAILSEKIVNASKSDRPKIAAKSNAEEASTAKIVQGIETPKTSRIGTQSDSNLGAKNSARSNDKALGRESSKSSDVEIVGSIRTAKAESSRNTSTGKPTGSGKNSSSSDEKIPGCSEKLDTQKVQKIETSKASSSKTMAESSKSVIEEPIQELSESPEVVIVRNILPSKTATSKVPIANEVVKVSAKPTFIQLNCSSESPEIKIIETPKIVSNAATEKNTKSFDSREAHSSSAASVDKIVKEPKEQIKTRPMPRCIKIAAAYSLSGNASKPAVSQSPPESPKASSKVPQITNCEILKEDILRKIPISINGTIGQSKKSLSPVSTNEYSSSEKPSSLKSSTSKPIISEVAVVVERLSPLIISGSTSHSKSNNSESVAVNGKNDKSSKSENSDSSSVSSKNSDGKIVKGPAEKKSEVPCENAKISNGNSSKSSNSEATAGSSNSSEKSDEIVSAVEKDSTEIFEPQPGCSYIPAAIDNPVKPLLVVKAKMPAYTVQQDTFAMFLSLCLQTERDDAMKKIVAKLKRYHDEMDPAYARSREFEELLNAKRDKIEKNGRKRVYLYASHVMEEMKLRNKSRKIKDPEKTDRSEVKRRVEENSAADPPKETAEAEELEEEEEDSSEARKRRHTIKKIERAMKQCEKQIKKLEETEVDSDDDNNNSYMKLDRYQLKMIELWNKMCEYTNEHADAGRPYLRPKHVRVTQIPVVDQAINSFINSRVGGKRKKSKKGTSFIDGIIFPDYVDILDCIAKVNDEQKLRLDKRAQEKMAQTAFTQLGEHLQTTRQNDYWDTFSLHLENNEDPATKDAELSEKLAQNQEISRTRTAEVFEEFVKKQEEIRSGNRGENAAENEDEEDDDEEEEEEDDAEEEADNKSNCDNISDLELPEDDDDDHESMNNNEGQVPSPKESIDEGEKNESAKVEDSTSEEEGKNIGKNNNPDEKLASTAKSPKNSTGQEAAEKEVRLVEDANKPEGEKRSLLRIRSFAKPPESWQASQEELASPEDSGSKQEASKSLEDASGVSKNIETIDVTEEDNISVVSKGQDKKEQLKTFSMTGRPFVVQHLGNKTILTTEKGSRVIVLPSSVTSSKNRSSIFVQSPNQLPTNQSASNQMNANNSSNFAQTSKYVMLPAQQSLPRSHSNIPQQLGIPQAGKSNLQLMQAKSSNQINVNNSSNFPQTSKNWTIPTQQLQPRSSNIPTQLRVSQPGNSNLQPRVLNSSQQIVTAPQVVGRRANGNSERSQPLNNAQQIRTRNPTISERAQVPQTQIRSVPLQQARFPVVQNVQISRKQLAQLRNGQFIAGAGISQSQLSGLNSGSQTRPLIPSVNGQPARLAMLSNPRVVQAQQIPIRRTANVPVLRLSNGQLLTRPGPSERYVQVPLTNIEGTNGQCNGKILNSCENSVVVPANNAAGQSTTPVLKLRANDNTSTTSATIQHRISQQRSQPRVRHPGNKNRWSRESREAPSKK